jgi:hypothetical protein
LKGVATVWLSIRVDVPKVNITGVDPPSAGVDSCANKGEINNDKVRTIKIFFMSIGFI